MNPILGNPKLLPATLATPQRLGSAFDDSESVDPSAIDAGSPIKQPVKKYKDLYRQYGENDADWIDTYEVKRAPTFDYGIKTLDDLPDVADIQLRGRKGNFGPRTYKENPARRALWNLVGSEHAQRIYQDNNFMSENALKVFNKKRLARGQQPFTYKWETGVADSDTIPEFVVYDHHGNIVAVNGYTTGRSDWDMRNKYSHAYPTSAKRKEKPYNAFIDEYQAEHMEDYGIEYDAAGYLTEASKERVKQIMKESPYKTHLKIPSSYSIFCDLLNDTVEQTLNDWGAQNDYDIDTLKLVLNEAYGYSVEGSNRKRGWEIPFKSQTWQAFVVRPFLASYSRSGSYRTYLDNWKRNHNIPDNASLSGEELEKFHKAVLAKKHVKEVLKQWVTPMFTHNNPARVRLAQNIMAALDHLLSGLKVNGKSLNVPDSASSRSLSQSQ